MEKKRWSLIFVAVFLTLDLSVGSVPADSPPYLDFAVYPVYETLTAAPSRDSIAMVVARVSSNPFSGLGVLEQTSSPSLSWLGPDGKPLPFQSNVEVEEFLRTAEIISQRTDRRGTQQLPEGLVGKGRNSNARHLSRCSC